MLIELASVNPAGRQFSNVSAGPQRHRGHVAQLALDRRLPPSVSIRANWRCGGGVMCLGLEWGARGVRIGGVRTWTRVLYNKRSKQTIESAKNGAARGVVVLTGRKQSGAS
jgi:hypothetical protein